VTQLFRQGRNLEDPLVDVPAEAGRAKRMALRVYGWFLWFVFAAAVAWVALRVAWVLAH
jgi:hypothetical protein